ncbi:hypothetical protein PAXRUDRAFT_543552 [Paxillus rubicundulus Ve08.2h10]|uniref:Uncharacterized protein n=1 Tax=Paxillus rubicundulus Ve08.2h10 TaxID=930991 RepID=A0A0D0DUV4_9AGAM|nr:hypothetical protein PAXRUDRAFT_543552 [Paxillus rubicundulus Ve08.2h10]
MEFTDTLSKIAFGPRFIRSSASGCTKKPPLQGWPPCVEKCSAPHLFSSFQVLAALRVPMRSLRYWLIGLRGVQASRISNQGRPAWVIGRALRPTRPAFSLFSLSPSFLPVHDRYDVRRVFALPSRITKVTADWKAQISGTDRGP